MVVLVLELLVVPDVREYLDIDIIVHALVLIRLLHPIALDLYRGPNNLRLRRMVISGDAVLIGMVG